MRDRGQRMDLDAARSALARWRRESGGAGRRIPADMWAMAADVARTSGVTETARALRLSATKLAALAGRAGRPGGAENAPLPAVSFVELDGFELGAGSDTVVIRLFGRAGDQVRVDIPRGGVSAVVVELARAFWGRGV